MSIKSTQSPQNLYVSQNEDTLNFNPKQVYISKLKNVKTPRNKAVKVSLFEFSEGLSNPAKEQEFSNHHKLDLKEKSQAKQTDFHAYTISIGFDGELTGILAVDIDHVRAKYNKVPSDIIADITGDPYIMIGSDSNGGDGVFLLIRYPKENDIKAVLRAFADYLKMVYGLEIDFLPDKERLRIDSYCKKPLRNWGAEIYTDTLNEEVQEISNDQDDAFDKLSTGIAQSSNSDIKRGFEIINPMFEAQGFIITKGKGKEAYIYNRPGGEPRSIIALINEGVIKFAVKSNTLKELYGKDKFNFYEMFRTIGDFDDYTALKELSSLGYGQFNEAKPMKSNGKESYTSIMEYVSALDIRQNILTGVIEFNGRPITDIDLSIIMTELALLHGKNPSKEILLTVIDVIANGNQYHPFLEFVKELEKLEATDFGDIDELDSFINCFTSSTPNTLIRIYFIRWMLGLFDIHLNHRMTKNVLVVSGAQNSGKTSLAKNILPDSLKQYGKVIDFNMNKMTDSKIALCSFLVACFDEFEEILSKHRTLSEFKNLTSSYDIFERRPYRRNHEQMYRASIAMATTNEKQILTDSTGNTRFLTLDVQAFDLNKYFKIDLMKLWRVVYDYHLQGETSVLNDSERTLQATENLEFESEDFCEGLIKNIFRFDQNGFLNTTDILIELERHTKQPLSLKRIGSALRKMGIDRVAKKVKGRVYKGYELKMIFDY